MKSIKGLGSTSFMGPWILAWLTEKFASQRVGMSIAMLFLLVGAIGLCFVGEKRGIDATSPYPGLSKGVTSLAMRFSREFWVERRSNSTCK